MNNRNIEFNVSFISFIRKLEEMDIRLLYFIFNKVNWDNPQSIIQVSIYEAFTVLGLSPTIDNKSILDNSFKRLMQLHISCNEAMFNIIYSVEHLNEYSAKIELSPFLKDHFINIIKTIAIIPLDLIGNFRSNQTAYLFWKLCEEFCHDINVFSFSTMFTTEEMKKVFDVGEDLYRNKAQSNTFFRTSFEHKVIDKSVEEINKSKVGMQVSYEKVKEKNRVLGYRFTVCFSDIGKIYRPINAENMRVQLFGKENV